jgi:hypothetical protein
MRMLMLLLFALGLPLSSQAYDGEEYPEQYDSGGEVYQEESYPEESYPQESYPEPSYPEETYQEPHLEEMPVEEPAYQQQSDIVEQEELRATCQEYAAPMPPEEQAAYIEECLRSHGY